MNVAEMGAATMRPIRADIRSSARCFVIGMMLSMTIRGPIATNATMRKILATPTSGTISLYHKPEHEHRDDVEACAKGTSDHTPYAATEYSIRVYHCEAFRHEIVGRQNGAVESGHGRVHDPVGEPIHHHCEDIVEREHDDYCKQPEHRPRQYRVKYRVLSSSASAKIPEDAEYR